MSIVESVENEFASDGEDSHVRDQNSTNDSVDVAERLVTLAGRIVRLVRQTGTNFSDKLRGSEREWIEFVVSREIDRVADGDSALTADLSRVIRRVILPRFERPRVLCLGPTGSFTHSATRRFFKGDPECILCDDVTCVFERLWQGEADFAVIAIHNSIADWVTTNVCLVQKYLRLQNRSQSPIRIIGRQALGIELFLMGHGNELRDIRRIHTHEVALEQCAKNLKSLKEDYGIPAIEVVPETSTSAAAQIVARDQTGRVAAIAQIDAARNHGLNVLRANMEDHLENQTQFLILGRETTAHIASSKWCTALSVSYQGSEEQFRQLFDRFEATCGQLDFCVTSENGDSASAFVEVEGDAEGDRARDFISAIRNGMGVDPVVLGAYPVFADSETVPFCEDAEADRDVISTCEGPSQSTSTTGNGRAGHASKRRRSVRRPPVPVQAKSQLRIGIIGIAGQYGRWLETLFRDQFGYHVDGSDPKLLDGPSNRSIVENSDVVIFSVSLDQAVETINELTPYSNEAQLWLDVTSVKARPVGAMLKSKAEVIGLHPMCAPSVGSWKNQPVVICPARCQRWLEWVRGVLDVTGAEARFKDAATHDQEMAALQVLPHTINMLAGAVLRSMNVNVEDVVKCATPTFSMMWYGLNRVLANDPNLVADLQLENESHAIATLERIVEEANRMLETVRQRRRDDFTLQFAETKRYIGKELQEQASRRMSDFVRINADLDNQNCFVMRMGEDRPGLLGEAASLVGSAGLNMTSINSFPMHDGGYRFHVGFTDDPNSVRVQAAIQLLRTVGWDVVDG